MELLEFKRVWNDVLDELEATNRIAWLAFFDARLVSLENHDLKSVSSENSHVALIAAIKKITGIEVTLSF